MGSVQTHTLSYVTGATTVDDSKAATFGHMVRLAAPIMRAFQGDLFYDAQWLNDVMTGQSFTFVFAVDQSGTEIGHEGRPLTREHVFRFTVTTTDGQTVLTIETV